MADQLLDPATEEHFWTQADIDGVLEELGRRTVSGRFNPATWEGEDFEFKFADGQTRKLIPEYVGVVVTQWK